MAKDELREDAASVETDGGLLVATVADGHGMRRAFRAEIGSELAVLAVNRAAQVGRPAWMVESDEAALLWVKNVFSEAVVECWRELVADHARDHPFVAEEIGNVSPAISADAVPKPEAIWLSYGCTVLAALATPARVLLWQIGDGDIIAGRPDEPGSRALPDDPANHGNATSSICQSDAVSRARAAVLDVTTGPLMVVLATDGFGNAMAAEDWRSQLTGDLFTRMADSGFPALADDLPGWAAACSTASGDDVSVIVLASEPGAAGLAQDVVVDALVPQSTARTSVPQLRWAGAPPWAIGLGGALLLLIGSAVGYVAGNHAAAPQPVPATSQPQETVSPGVWPSPSITLSTTPTASLTGRR